MADAILITINGITKNITEWCLHFDIGKSSVYRRVKKGWSYEDALKIPESDRFKYNDLVGRLFGKLIALRFLGDERLWECVCTCGNAIKVPRRYLVRKDNPTRSCGCTFDRVEVSRKRATTHGKSKTRVYNAWLDMRKRCSTSSSYMKKGIKICERWLQSFENFYTDMGDPPHLFLSLDRINNDGDYTPDNCRWATRKEQNINRSTTKWITIDNETKTLTDWCLKFDMHWVTVKHRTNKGWTIEDALTIPTYRTYRNRKVGVAKINSKD